MEIANRYAGKLSSLIYSIVLGVPFAAAWLGFTAARARDGRSEVTDWLDPMLAGLTLLAILFAELVLVVIWDKLTDGMLKSTALWGLIISQWFYIFGEILSNTITIGEPPEDIGSLFEIAGGAITFLSAIILVFMLSTKIKLKPAIRVNFSILAAALAIGMLWWFTHPIDQSTPDAPDYIENNPVYNLFH